MAFGSSGKGMGVDDSIPRNGEQDMNEKKHSKFRNSVQIGGNENGKKYNSSNRDSSTLHDITI